MTIKEILRILRRRILFLVIIPVIAVIGTAIVSFQFITPKYTSTTQIYVCNFSEDGSISYPDLQIALSLVNDYREMISSRSVRDAVEQNLGFDISEYTTSVSAVNNNTRMINISVTGPSPDVAMNIANEIVSCFNEKFSEITKGVQNVAVFSPASRPKLPSSPNKTRNVVYSAIISFAATIGLVILLERLNTTLRTSEDVEKHLGIPILAAVPKVSR